MKSFLSITISFFFHFIVLTPALKAQLPNLLIQSTSTSSSDFSNGRSTAIDASGNMYIVGNFGASVSFGSTTLVSAGGQDIFLAKYNASGALQWAKRAGGTSSDYGYGVAVSGNSVYITGAFSFDMNFNTPSATGSNEITSAGSLDIFLAKYDDAGTFQWAKRAGGTGSDVGYGVAVVETSVYITGSFNSTADFNTPSATGSNEISSIGASDIFLAKYDDTGTFQWAKRAGGTGSDFSYSVAVSETAVYITGNFTFTANFNTPSATGSNEITSAGNADIFLAKYDNTGTFQWAKRAGGTTGDVSNNVAVSGTAVYITGYFTGSANFNTPSATGSNEITPAGSLDIFLAKYDGTGTLQWAKRAGGSNSDISNNVAVSGTAVYITGYFNGTANFNTPSATGSNEITSAGGQDVFLAQYDGAGVLQWTARAGGTGNDNCYGIAVSGTSVYITGSFRGTANFNTPSATGSNELTTTSSSGDAFIARYGITVLPVELLSFTGTYISPSGGLRGATEGANLLTWATANEVNNKGFEVEASPDPSKGGEWQTLGFVATKGKGSNYEFTDKVPLWGVGGLSYYRLRQIDNDGKVTLSKVISITQTGKGKGLAVYPNPVSNILTVHTEGSDFQILNLLGQQVMSGKAPFGGLGAGLDVSALPQGSYVFKVGAEQVKFIKQ